MNKSLGILILMVIGLAAPTQAETMKTYYPGGKVQMEITDTSQKTYYEDGKLMSEITLNNGEPVGVSKYYHPNGKLMREDDHAKGEWKQYDENGNLAAEGKS